MSASLVNVANDLLWCVPCDFCADGEILNILHENKPEQTADAADLAQEDLRYAKYYVSFGILLKILASWQHILSASKARHHGLLYHE